MNALLPWLRYFARLAGLPGVLGVGIIVISGIFYLSVTLPRQESIPVLQQQHAQLQMSSMNTGDAVKTKLSRSDRIENFHTFFPERKNAFGWISILYKIADKERLTLSHGEYRSAGPKDKHPAQLQIQLPVTGSYTQIRRFITSALAEIPFLALDEIDFQRSQSGGSEIEAKIRFTLFLRNS